jgi:hypothetical protein
MEASKASRPSEPFSQQVSKDIPFLVVAGAGKGIRSCPWAGPRNARRDVSMWMLDGSSDESQEPVPQPHVAVRSGAEISRVFLGSSLGRRWRVVIGGEAAGT